jgi:hypothetical protein
MLAIGLILVNRTYKKYNRSLNRANNHIPIGEVSNSILMFSKKAIAHILISCFLIGFGMFGLMMLAVFIFRMALTRQ